MNRTFLVRVLGVLAITLGLALSMATGASAQFALKAPAPGSQISVQQNKADTAGAPAAATSENQISVAYRCGYWGGDGRKWYTHCGSAYSIYIKVEFNYGWANPEYMWVGKGTTNLSYQFRHRSAAITDAWCLSNCY